jgi:hypothetical protein
MMHLRYLKSQLRHKWFVFVECCKLGIPHLGIIHDLSKFLPSEWRGYACYFYGNFPAWDELGAWGKSHPSVTLTNGLIWHGSIISIETSTTGNGGY